jgi:REP element-mobilizing transposase RayT
MEKHLAAGAGTCLLSNSRYAESVVGELLGLAPLGLDVPHYSIMPNHWHALITPRSANAVSLGTAMKRVKGRTGRQIRAGVGGTGPIWQREWFDHWIRNEAEWEKTVAYIQNNPVKAGIVSHWRHHPWTK